MAPRINQPVAKRLFEIEIPSDFSVETVPLKRTAPSK